MPIGIQVAVRCRPFVCKDKLGVQLLQNSETEGEVNLLRSKYSTNRFAFSWAWWSAYNYKRYLEDSDSISDAETMTNTSSESVYEQCGEVIKKQVLEGDAVVLFAYGLSGSGKTFTVFGPDAADIPEAWFKHAKPHPLWGIFPHLAYDLFQMRKDGWKLTLKYFQNVVDIVRDLMSPIGQEKSYKEGMRKDKDGFTDIMWCTSADLKDWNDLRTTFLAANGRKAIAPTQFNPQSTRGHCIMTLEVIMPKEGSTTSKQRGRIYVCDLAGTEPAGDIFYAQYQKKKFENGDVEWILKGPHKDASKTKELQSQGKKINLSLSEMAQFFMKMANAIKKNKLKAGQSIPGCNTFFLCKYLKDTMLQARTYLFCAIRPEVKFLQYTFSTMTFAKNASVIKLQPKKASVAMSKKERALMEELQRMKLQMEEMAKAGASNKSSGISDDEVQRQIAEARAQLQAELMGANQKANNEAVEKQKREYGRRGINLAEFDKAECADPYLLNQDLDAFRSARFMFILKQEETVFGKDIKPMDFAITDNHCTVRKAGDGKLTLIGGTGETFHNGSRVEQGAEVSLSVGDRVVMASVMTIVCVPGQELSETMSAEDIAAEFRKAKLSDKDSAEMQALQAQKEAWDKQKAEMQAQMDALKKQASDATTEAEKAAARQAEKEINEKMAAEESKQVEKHNRSIMLDLIPKVDEACKLLDLLNRGTMRCDAILRVALSEDGSVGIPEVKVKVENLQTDEVIFLDPYEFENVLKVMRNEVGFLAANFQDNTPYEVSDSHDPMTMFYEPTFELGTASVFNEMTLYYLAPEDDEKNIEIKNVADPKQDYGKLECYWIPVTEDGEDMYDKNGDLINEETEMIIESPTDLIGKKWNYRFVIKGTSKLPIIASKCYCQYMFDGQVFATEVVEENTDRPSFNYSCMHTVESVDEEFVERMQKACMNVHIFVSPFMSQPPTDKLSTSNRIIAKKFGFNDGTSIKIMPFVCVHEFPLSLLTFVFFAQWAWFSLHTSILCASPPSPRLACPTISPPPALPSQLEMTLRQKTRSCVSASRCWRRRIKICAINCGRSQMECRAQLARQKRKIRLLMAET